MQKNTQLNFVRIFVVSLKTRYVKSYNQKPWLYITTALIMRLKFSRANAHRYNVPISRHSLRFSPRKATTNKR